MQIGAIADIHACPSALESALREFEAAGIERIFCAGDIAGYFGDTAGCIRLLEERRVECVIGNHDRDFIERQPQRSEARWLATLPRSLDLNVAGRRLLLVHAEPPDRVDGGIRLLDTDGNGIDEQIRLWGDRLANVPADLLIVGHSHQVYAHRFGKLLLVNPGSTVFNHSAAIIDLDDLALRFLPLEGHAILPSWNFSHAVSRPSPTCRP